jgi:hypothetical protein
MKNKIKNLLNKIKSIFCCDTVYTTYVYRTLTDKQIKEFEKISKEMWDNVHKAQTNIHKLFDSLDK